MIALSSLSKKAVAAYKERQKLAEVPNVPGMEEVAVSAESEMPWYVNEDVDYFMEKHKTEWYTAMELGNIVREFPQLRQRRADRICRTLRTGAARKRKADAIPVRKELSGSLSVGRQAA